MKFPPITTTPPTLSDFQYSFGGVTLGSQQLWAVQSADGLDLPKVRSADTGRPSDDGEFIGLDLLGGRDITLTLHTQNYSSDELRAASLTPLEAVMAPPADKVTESPLWFKRPGLEQLCCLVRPRQFRLKSDTKLAYAHMAQPVMLFHATGSLVYGPTQSDTVSVPSDTGTLSFPISFPFTFGGGTAAGVIAAQNNGTRACRPLIVFTGPMLNPSIQNASIAGNPTLTFGIQLYSGDELVVDLDLDSPTAVYYVAGSSYGTSRLSSLQPNSSTFAVEPGANTLIFTTADGAPTGGTCNVQWADAYALAA